MNRNPRNDADLMEATDDWVQYVIDKPMAQEPGKDPDSPGIDRVPPAAYDKLFTPPWLTRFFMIHDAPAGNVCGGYSTL